MNRTDFECPLTFYGYDEAHVCGAELDVTAVRDLP